MIEPYYHSGRVTLYNGKAEIVMPDMPNGSVDLTVTSPPYDNLRDYKGYTFDFETIARELYRVTKQGGVVVWVVGDATVNGSETGTSFKQALYFKEIGFNLHDTMIYGKKGFSSPSLNKYHQTFEYMFIFSKGKPKTFNPLKDRKNLKDRRDGFTRRQKDGSLKGDGGTLFLEKYGMRYNIWIYEIGKFKVTKDEIAYKHPAIFPEELAQDHIISWSNENDIVFDPMMGSGTTGKMAMKLNRKFIGIDTALEYCEIAKSRIHAAELMAEADLFR